MEISPQVLKALNGFSMPVPSNTVGDEFNSKVYSSAVVKNRKYTTARDFEEKPLEPNSRKPDYYLPRLFGKRITREQAKDPDFVNSVAQQIYDEIDRIFMPSELEYSEGAIPLDGGETYILRVITWLPMEIIPLPLVDDYLVRTVMNVEYGKAYQLEEMKEYFRQKYYE